MNEWNQSFGPSELRLNRDGYRNASGWAYFMTRFLIMKGKKFCASQCCSIDSSLTKSQERYIEGIQARRSTVKPKRKGEKKALSK